MTGSPTAPAGTAAIVWGGLLGLACAMGIGRFAFTPVLPLMLQAGELALAGATTLAAANYLGYLAGALASLWLRPRPERAARRGLVIVTLSTAAMALPVSLEAWMAARFVAGAASAFVLVGVSACTLPLLAARGRAPASGAVFAGVGAGIALAGLVGLAAAAAGAAPSAVWLLLAALAAAMTALAWRPLADAARATAAQPSPAAAAPGSASGRDALWPLVLAYGVFGFGYILPATFLPALARRLLDDPLVFGAAWPALGLAAAASTVLAATRLARVPPRRQMGGGLLVLAAGVLAPALSGSGAAIAFAAVAVGGTFMIVTMSGLQAARQVAGGNAPHAMAAMTAAFALGQLLGPLAVRPAPTLEAALHAPAIVSAVALALAAGLVLAVPPRVPFRSSSPDEARR